MVFFFWEYGTRKWQLRLPGVELPKEKCDKCHSNIYNIHFNVRQYELYWIGLGTPGVDFIELQCIRCGKTYHPKKLEFAVEMVDWLNTQIDKKVVPDMSRLEKMTKGIEPAF